MNTDWNNLNSPAASGRIDPITGLPVDVIIQPNISQPSLSGSTTARRSNTATAVMDSQLEPTLDAEFPSVHSRPLHSGSTETFLREETINVVSDLQRINLDSSAGWRTASGHIEDASLKSHFEQIARQRDQFAAELANLLMSAGKTPIESGSVAGTLHRWWLTVRSAVGVSNIYPVLAEAERGEDSIKEHYEKALREPLSASVSDLIAQQYAKVKRIHDEVRDLRDVYANKKS